MPEYALEICAFNIQSAIIAERAGAARVELCDNPLEGGTTPSYGTVKQTRERIGIELYPIIRPRAGHSFYNDDELSIIFDDIRICKDLGCEGISIGIQLRSGAIDIDRMSRIVELAYPMGVTCHRAFDAVPDPHEALEQLIAIGVERILTSGQKSSAPEGALLLRSLVEQADERIIIMPGAGVRSENIAGLKKSTGAREFHTSARKAAVDRLDHSNDYILDSGSYFLAQEEEIRRCVEGLNRI